MVLHRIIAVDGSRLTFKGDNNDFVDPDHPTTGHVIGRLRVQIPHELMRYCVEKGSVAVDGVALTITEIDEDGFAVALIPHTLAETTLGGFEPGDEVNLEADVLAKFVERLVARD